ncbi:MAG TPA: sulfurtransferase [Chloroflexota bacterium]|nr:sulfurtransferase [Chloroflexota bacterium]
MIGRSTRRAATGVLVGLGGWLAAACGASTGTSAPPAGGGGSTSAPAATNPSVFVNPNLVVSVDWLKANAKAPNVRIVDSRPAADYEKGHIPGAVNLPVVDTFDPGKDRNYPDTKEKLEALFGNKGIGDGLRVITYDAGNGTDTTGSRLLWTLEYAGHTNVAWLDGGIKAWQAAAGELSTEAVTVPAAKFASKIDPAKMPTKEQCETAIGDPTKVVLDARSPEEYRGDDVRAKFGGHIPGAVNIDYRLNYTPAGTLKAPPELRQMYESKGVTANKEVIAHCQTGQRSSSTYLVLRLLGYNKVGNYVGSWVEWGNDAETKKVQGA